MDTEASGEKDLPAFGSAIFNFTSAMSNARISAHVCVLFIENDKDDEESQGAQGKMINEPEVSEVAKEQKGKAAASTQEDEKQTGQIKKAGQRMEEETLPAEAKEETYGWCRIVEEPVDD